MQRVNIETIKRQAEETDRLINDMEITGVCFESCRIIQMDVMTLIASRDEVKEPTKLIRDGDHDLTIIVNREGDLLSWSVSADNPGWKVKRLEVIGAA